MPDSRIIVHEQVELLKTQIQRQSELLHELERSLAMETLWPTVFQHGKVSCVMSKKEDGSGTLRVRDGEGVERAFSLSEVPDILKQPNAFRTAE